MERDVEACIILGHGNSEVLTPVPFHSSASKHDMPNLKMKQNKTSVRKEKAFKDSYPPPHEVNQAQIGYGKVCAKRRQGGCPTFSAG